MNIVKKKENNSAYQSTVWFSEIALLVGVEAPAFTTSPHCLSRAIQTVEVEIPLISSFVSTDVRTSTWSTGLDLRKRCTKQLYTALHSQSLVTSM